MNGELFSRIDERASHEKAFPRSDGYYDFAKRLPRRSGLPETSGDNT